MKQFAKGRDTGKRLVVLDEVDKRDIVIPANDSVIRGVSKDIRCDKGDQIRFKSNVLELNQQATRPRARLPGIKDEVKKDVAPNWDPGALSRFIQRYGTHIVVGMAVGGQDVVCVRQKPSSSIPPPRPEKHLEDLGDSWFSDGRSLSPHQRQTREKQKVPDVFHRILQANTMQLTSIIETSSKDGLAIVCSKKGGDVFLHNHYQWLQTDLLTDKLFYVLVLCIAAARDVLGKQDRVVTVISNVTTMAGQIYEAMSNAGYLDSNMVVILNGSRYSLHPKLEEGSKTTISALSTTLSKL
ncbi:hypothetical protein IFM89_037121 [Coptis chinensis]|uniref:MACPF domain-containing protein n=1 Tax=Coptis chinensis TaxID=261450 RepID=A0A835LKJ9_9MAGN|nr:hypothetical protein IFM89_037121 [Coptis chinensis]